MLCETRNEYIHYSPKSWHIDLRGFSDNIIGCIELLKKIIDYSIESKSFLSSKIDLVEMKNEIEELEIMFIGKLNENLS